MAEVGTAPPRAGTGAHRGGRSWRRQAWRYLRAGMGLVLRHPVVSVCLVPVLPDGRVVLFCRVDNRRWSLPGGLIDWGEEVLAAARRELREETGLALVRLVRLQGVYSSPERDPRTHAITVTLVVEVAGEMRAEDDLEVRRVRPFATADLPWDTLAHDHARQLRDFLSGATVVA